MVFLTGATGYMGSRLSAELTRRGHRVRALVRPGSEKRAPRGCEICLGDALDAASYQDQVRPATTLVHLVGVPHPSPAKAGQFRTVDLPSVLAAVAAAKRAQVRHMVYVSVAQPAPVMHAYIGIRRQGEAAIRAAGLNATILRPWYVLGPGHWWPVVLKPVYWMLERASATEESARRLGLVTIREMVAALADAVERPADGVRVLEVPQIRACAL
jgi:uncharacterized protein YbjT (DUF2867 family)